ncbi:MAG TPA: PDZ domain-containing protein [Thermoanaerobacterales bacterium]|nr:PDZ domain-containing protein [Thermoanaerobacterales bacterium]
MSKFKKIAVACVVLVVLLLQAGLSLAQPLDVEGHWAKGQILEWLDKGWAQCSDDGRFYPDDKITRGEFIALTNKAFGFTRVPLEYEGNLEVSPKSAKSGTNQTFTLTYTLGDNFDEGWIEFGLPEEMAVTVGQDKVEVNGVEKILDKADVSDDGQKVHVAGITAKKGDKVTLTIYDKTIPEVGPYFFKVRADADGEKGTKPATLGAGSEFMAFLAYSKSEENKNIIDTFIKAINWGDFEIAIDLLADDAVYVNNYMDGYFEMYKSKEEIAEYINIMLEYGGTLENNESTLIELSENVWQVEGKAHDYGTILTAELNPDDGFEGLGYTAKFFVTDKKVCYVEFTWNREDEILMDKLNEGAIGVFMAQNERGETVILACVPGMPAEKAGLAPGDIVVAVNGIKINEMEGYGEARFRMLGKVGTKVILTINRSGEIFDVEIERAVY